MKGEEGRVGEVERRGVCTTEELLCQRTCYQRLVKSQQLVKSQLCTHHTGQCVLWQWTREHLSSTGERTTQCQAYSSCTGVLFRN